MGGFVAGLGNPGIGEVESMFELIRVFTLLISGELLGYSLTIPSEYKMRKQDGPKMKKWIFRKAFEKDLPHEIVWRAKQEFSQGSGSDMTPPAHFEKAVSYRGPDLRGTCCGYCACSL